LAEAWYPVRPPPSRRAERSAQAGQWFEHSEILLMLEEEARGRLLQTIQSIRKNLTDEIHLAWPP
jgi:hypothetical protein